MANLIFQVPTQFLASMNKLMGAMQPFTNFARGMTIRQPNVQQLSVGYQTTVQDFRRLNQTLKRVELNIQRSISFLSNPFGTQAKLYLRTVNVERLIALIPDIALDAITGRVVFTWGSPVGPFALAGVAFIKGIESLVGTTSRFSGIVFRDSVQAAGLGAKIGGLRALQVMSGQYPGLMEALAGTSVAQTDQMSLQFMISRMLGIRQMMDSTGQTLATMLAVQSFVKSLPAGNFLQIARTTGLTSQFSPQLLRKLRSETQQQLMADIAAEQALARRLDLSQEVQRDYRNLYLALQQMSNTVTNSWLKTLAEGQPSFVQAFAEVSRSITSFIDVAMTSKEFAKLMHLLRYEFYAFVNLIKDLTRSIKGIKYPHRLEFARRIGIPTVSHGVFRPGIPIHKYEPPRVAATRETHYPEIRRVPEFRPGVHVPTAETRAPTVAPGRRDFAERLQMPRPKPGAIPPTTRPRQLPAAPVERAAPVAPGRAVTQPDTDTDAAIKEGARVAGVDVSTMRAYASIESGMNPSSNRYRDTQYKGLFQLNQQDMKDAGTGGDIFNARDNAVAAGTLLHDHREWFHKQYGRYPTDAELYMMHQQGRGFVSKGTMTNIGGNPYPGMRGPQTPESFQEGWGREIERRKSQFGGSSTSTAPSTSVTPGSSTSQPKPDRGIPSASPQLSTDNSGRPIDPAVLKQAESLAANHDVPGVYRFIRSQGYNVDSNYCGDFVSAVVRAQGGTPVKGGAVASNWAKYGDPVEPGQERPGDIAVTRYQTHGPGRGQPIQPGETGAHVGMVGSGGSGSDGTFQFFGANTTEERQRNESQFIFRRPRFPQDTEQQKNVGPPEPSPYGNTSPYSRWYFQNQKQSDDVPFRQKVKIDNTSESVDLQWTAPQTETYSAPF